MRIEKFVGPYNAWSVLDESLDSSLFCLEQSWTLYRVYPRYQAQSSTDCWFDARESTSSGRL